MVTRISVGFDRVIGGEKTPIFGVTSALRDKLTQTTDSARKIGQNRSFGLMGQFRLRAGARPIERAPGPRKSLDDAWRNGSGRPCATRHTPIGRRVLQVGGARGRGNGAAPQAATWRDRVGWRQLPWIAHGRRGMWPWIMAAGMRGWAHVSPSSSLSSSPLPAIGSPNSPPNLFFSVHFLAINSPNLQQIQIFTFEEKSEKI